MNFVFVFLTHLAFVLKFSITFILPQTSNPVKTRAYRVPELLKVEVERQVDDLLRLGFIEPSDSPMTSGVVCVIKPDKSVPMCCDDRFLNSKTIPDAMPMQIVADCVHKVSRAKFISICDAKSGLWQVEIAPEDRWKSAFVTHHGVWQWKRCHLVSEMRQVHLSA